MVFFNEFYFQRKPVILRGLDIGECVEKWTLEYLMQQGGDKSVKIHVSELPQMDFINKNFVYRFLNCSFSSLILNGLWQIISYFTQRKTMCIATAYSVIFIWNYELFPFHM